MKKYFYIIIVLPYLFHSCKTKKTSLAPFVTVYKNDWVGNIYPEYILLKHQTQTFEKFAPGIYESIIGEWQINNDTLYLYPKYEYLLKNDTYHLSQIENKEKGIRTISQKFLIKINSLIDLTEYEIYNVSSENKNTVYNKVNNR